MTVKELIEVLEKCDDNMNVVVKCAGDMLDDTNNVINAFQINNSYDNSMNNVYIEID